MPGPAQPLIKKLNSPVKVQAWLRTLEYNSGNTMYSLHGVLRRGRAHCLEAALSAAALLEPHGYPPLILDLESADLLDHTVFLYQHHGKYGSVGMSRDVGLHGRKPVFKDIRSLAASYALPYIDERAELQAYGLLDLRSVRRSHWRTVQHNVWHVEEALRVIPHQPLRISPTLTRHWRKKYIAFRQKHPNQQPNDYPGQNTWL